MIRVKAPQSPHLRWFIVIIVRVSERVCEVQLNMVSSHMQVHSYPACINRGATLLSNIFFHT